jgi:GGDEF domain-containing protein
MPPHQVTLILLAILLAANALLLVLLPLASRARRTGAPTAVIKPVRTQQPKVTGEPATDDEGISQAIEAFVQGVAPASSPVRAVLRSDEPHVRPSHYSAVAVVVAVAGEDEVEGRSRPVRPANGPATRILDPVAWDRVVGDESTRFARFRRPITIVSIEVSGLARVGESLGLDVASRVADRSVDLLVSETRATDRIARLDDARFRVLLVETDEHVAICYVDRVRRVVDAWLQSAGLAVSLSIGWAKPGEAADVFAAVGAAEQRMHAQSSEPSHRRRRANRPPTNKVTNLALVDERGIGHRKPR